MNDLHVIFDGVSAAGLRHVTMMRVGKPVDLKAAAELVPYWAARSGMAGRSDHVKGERVKRYYLDLWWPVREVVRFEGGDVPLDVGVMWRLEKGERMGMAFREAAELFWGNFGRWPERGFARRLPKGAPERLIFDDGIGAAFGQGEGILLAEAVWVPRYCLVVG